MASVPGSGRHRARGVAAGAPLSRRQFQLALVAALAMPGLPAAAATAATAAADPSRRILNRLTFGATASGMAELAAQGLPGWLDKELAKPVSDPALAGRLSHAVLAIEYAAGADERGRTWPAVKEDRPYRSYDAGPLDLLRLTDYSDTALHYEERQRPLREVQAASLIRAVHADAQLREVMTQFWHDHFSVNGAKDENTAAFFVEHDRIMRRHAFGNFRQFLGDVVRSPSMLFYLDNQASRASPANENFARELLELHTLGAENYANDRYASWRDVPGAVAGRAEVYIDQDVYEAARALTGWSRGDGRDLGEGDTVPMTGAFHYIARWHDPYQKRILGREFPANAGPMADGEHLLDLLAEHPGTARFIARKIAMRLLMDDPPEELVAGAAATFLASAQQPDQIARVIRHIVLSPVFLAAPPQKLKRPMEFLAALYRAVGAEVTSPSLGFHWALIRCGWSQHEWRPPTGHPDSTAHWANTNTITGLMTLGLEALEPWFAATRFEPAAMLPAGMDRMDAAAASVTGPLLGAEAAAALGPRIAQAIGGGPDATLDGDREGRNWQLRAILAVAALQPQFLYR